MRLSDEVRVGGAPSAIGARRQVYSGFNIAFWYQYLEHYEDKIVVDFLRFGWPINFHCEVFPISTFRNQPSATSNSVYIAKDLAHWAVWVLFHVILLVLIALFRRLCDCSSVTPQNGESSMI